jgi:hypothetical protein
LYKHYQSLIKKTPADNGAVLRNGGCNSSEIFINFAALFLVRAAVNPATAAKPPTRYMPPAVSTVQTDRDRERKKMKKYFADIEINIIFAVKKNYMLCKN